MGRLYFLIDNKDPVTLTVRYGFGHLVYKRLTCFIREMIFLTFRQAVCVVIDVHFYGFPTLTVELSGS